jgi:hypothetical protein
LRTLEGNLCRSWNKVNSFWKVLRTLKGNLHFPEGKTKNPRRYRGFLFILKELIVIILIL